MTQYPRGENLAQAVLSKLIADIVPDELMSQVALRMKAVPGNPEVLAMEQAAAHERRQQLLPLQPLLLALTTQTAQVVSAFSDETFFSVEDNFSSLLFQTTVAILAELIDMGVLHLPHESA